MDKFNFVKKLKATIELLQLRRVIFLLFFIYTIYLGKNIVLLGFSIEQQITLGLLFFAIYLWTFSTLPSGSSSMLILGCLLLFNLVGKVEQAFVGFLSPAIYFVFLLTMISNAIVKANVDHIIVNLIVRWSRGKPILFLLSLPFIMAILPIFLPSAVARFKMFHPIIERMNQYFNLSDKSPFKKYSIYIIGIMNQSATMITLTGGAFPVLASQLFNDYNIIKVSWLFWFFMIAPPLWLGFIIINIFVCWVLKININLDNYNFKGSKLPSGIKENNKKAIIVLISFLMMILVWIVIDQNKIPLLLPPMLLMVIYSLPSIGLVNSKDFEKFDWENFLLLGTSFSLGILMENNGTSMKLASELFKLVSQDASVPSQIIIISILLAFLRLLFVIPSSAIIVIFPVAISYSQIVNVSQVSMGFLVVMIIGGVSIFPVHSPTILLASNTKTLNAKEHYLISIFSSLVIVFSAIMAAIYYW